MTTFREKRRDLKYRGLLLCENCNRWTPVDMDTWSQTIRALRERGRWYVLLCGRPSCKRGRPEGLLSSLSPWQLEKVIRVSNPNSRLSKASVTYNSDNINEMV
jgi:hypothetical protein